MKNLISKHTQFFVCLLVLISLSTNSQSLRWGDDAQIGSEKNIYKITLDVDPYSGNILVAHASYNDVDDVFENCIYFSDNEGTNWSKTYSDTINGELLNLECAAFHNYFYVSYTTKTDSTVSVATRFNISNGVLDTFYGARIIDTMSAKVKEISTVSSIDYNNNSVYHYSLLANDSLKLCYSDTLADTCYPINTNIDNASHGLDACYSQGGIYTIYTSYLSNADSLLVTGKAFFCRHEPLFKDFLGNAPSETIKVYKTSVSAIGDTVMCIYNFWNNGITNLKYCYSDDAGATWSTGIIGDTLETNYLADITLRRNAGIGLIYEESRGGNIEGIFNWSDYTDAGWIIKDTILKNDPYYYTKPIIKQLTDTIYCVVYVGGDSNKAYFDKLDWLSGIKDISEEGKLSCFLKKKQISFIVEEKIYYYLSNRNKTNISIYNPLGEKVRTLTDEIVGPGIYSIMWDGENEKGENVPKGMYFIRLNTGNLQISRKILNIR